MAHQAGKELQFFQSRQLANGQWTSVRKETLVNSVWSGTPDQFWGWNYRSGFGYATTHGGIHYFDFNQNKWFDRRIPKDHTLIGIAPDQREHLGILTSPGGGLAGVFAGQYYSRDGGINWIELKTEFNIKVSPPRRAKTGELLTMGGVFSKPELHFSTDEGKTWQRRAEIALDRHITVLPSGLLLSVDRGLHGFFDISTSSDAGKTWSMEYGNFDRAAYEADKGRR